MTGRAREPADFSQTQPPDDEWLATAEPELPIDPDLPIIDTHTHLWHRGNGHRYFVEQLGRDISDSGHNVIATVYVECNSMYRAHGPSHLRPVGETEFAAGQAAIALSGRYGAAEIASAIVGFADLTLGDELPAILDAHIAAANGRLRGIRMRAKWDPDPVVKGANSAAGPGLYITPEFQRGLRQVAKRGLIFEASIFHPQIADVTALARAVPEAEIVLIHTGSPVGHGSYRGAEAGVHADWLRDMTELARCPNVSVKLGGMLMSLASYDFGLAERPINSAELAALWRPFLLPTLDLFGADRCMASSNFPVDRAGFTYGTNWNMLKRICGGCSEEEKARIFSGTAARIYKMSPRGYGGRS